ncbi:MmpS family transport accessory protein [Streptomyces luteireticuli]|uniref:MmpS family transport accessory protein n=1 Tax=Streptomyces luteireticuli TaxID=173858 RepID=UPI00355915FF
MKRSVRHALSALALAGLAVTAAVGCGAEESVKKAVDEVEQSASAAADEVEKKANGPFEVTYEVTADQPLDSVEYEEGRAAQKSVESPKAPWRTTVTLKDMTPPSVMVTGAGESGSVTCRILYKGKVIKEKTAKGEFANASCVAVAPRL